MEVAGLVYKISDAALAIDYGRKAFAIRGKADEGRIYYERGIARALSAFKDALRVLTVVEDSAHYRIVEQAFPRNNTKYRVNDFPKDSYHIACNAHRTRLKNVLRSPGIDQIEKALLKQRYSNLAAGQKGYCEKQGKALSNEK